MLQQHFLEQYTLLSLICISGRDVKSGNRINIVLLTPLKKNKKQSDKNPASTDFKSGERIKIMLLTPLKKYKTK